MRKKELEQYTIDNTINYLKLNYYIFHIYSNFNFVKKIAKNDYNELCNIADGFYVRVKITGVGVHRSFPLLSYVNDEGIRIFSNDRLWERTQKEILSM